jgi:hypothetical protein
VVWTYADSHLRPPQDEFILNKFCFLLGLVTKTNPRLTEDKRAQSPFPALQRQGKRLIHAWWNITYLRQHIMGSQFTPEENKFRPWANDERLQDPFQLGVMNIGIKLVQEFAILAEKLPEGRMPKTQSIPTTWEAIKNLKPESIQKLQTALKNIQDTFINKDNPVGAGSKRGKEDSPIEETDSKKGKDESEIDSATTKTRKTGSFLDNIACRQAFDEEGTHVLPLSAHHMRRLITHARFLCSTSKNIEYVPFLCRLHHILLLFLFGCLHMFLVLL